MKQRRTKEELAEEPLFQLSENEFFNFMTTCLSDYISINYSEFTNKDIEMYMFQVMLGVQLAQGYTSYVDDKTSAIKKEFFDNMITV